MKVLFLDIDGVLNGHEKLPGLEYCGIRPDCVSYLNRVIKETGCKLVISSAWRYIMLGGQMTTRGFQYLLLSHGVHLLEEDSVVGHTVADEKIGARGEQIKAWMHTSGKRLGVRQWAVVDDDPMGIDLGMDQWRFVRTLPDTGLCPDAVNRLIAILAWSE